MNRILFGEMAIQKGYLEKDDLDRALEEQKRLKEEQSVQCFIGEILIELNLMNEKQVLDVLTTLHVKEKTL